MTPRLPFTVGLLLFFSLCLLACGPAPDEVDALTHAEQEPTTRLHQVVGAVPWFELERHSGGTYSLDDLQGKVWIAGLVATDSPESQEHALQMKALQKELAISSLFDETQLVSFTVDPQRDTPDVLARFALDAGADPLSWQLLTGDSETLQTITRLLASHGKPTAATDSSAVGQHSDLALIDRLGRIRGFFPATDEAQRRTLLHDLERVAEEIKPLPYPSDIMSPPWLEERRRQQLATAGSLRVRHDFSFTNGLDASGIRFVHQVTEDSAKHYKTNHYDHGSGIATADIDGDGRLDLYFVSQVGSNELWRNLGGGRFEDITDSAGIRMADRIGVGASFADIDNDGDADLFVTTVRGGNALWINDGRGHFEDISESAGVGDTGHASGAVFFDYDRDGLLDLFVTNVGRYTTDEIGPGGYYVGYQVAFDGHNKPERSEPSILYRNLGDQRFEDVSERVGLVEMGWNGDALVTDLNDDGWLDLFITDMQGHDEYYENVGGTHFVDRSRELFPATPFGTMGIQALDFENDGKMDLFLTDMHTDMVRKMSTEEEKSKLGADEMPSLQMLGTDGNHVRGNAFFKHLADGGFEETSDRIGAENYWPWGLSRGDLNADGFEDVFIAASMSYGWRYGINSLLLNEGGERFRDSEFILGVEPRQRGIHARPWFELDCSGDDGDHFHCAERIGKWQAWGALGSRSSLIWDLDDDGDLDIVTNDFGAEPLVLISDLADRQSIHFLKIRLVGTTSSLDAVGASVTVRTAEGSQRKVNDGNSGYLSFSRMPLYFGLGDADTVDGIDILWPSGHRQTVNGPLKSNQLLTVTEQ